LRAKVSTRARFIFSLVRNVLGRRTIWQILLQHSHIASVRLYAHADKARSLTYSCKFATRIYQS
jgi:hypothetical protein